MYKSMFKGHFILLQDCEEAIKNQMIEANRANDAEEALEFATQAFEEVTVTLRDVELMSQRRFFNIVCLLDSGLHHAHMHLV